MYVNDIYVLNMIFLSIISQVENLLKNVFLFACISNRLFVMSIVIVFFKNTLCLLIATKSGSMGKLKL